MRILWPFRANAARPASDRSLAPRLSRSLVNRALRVNNLVNGPSDFHRVFLFSGMRGGQCVAAARVVPNEA